jgi:hypothetical protein
MAAVTVLNLQPEWISAAEDFANLSQSRACAFSRKWPAFGAIHA